MILSEQVADLERQLRTERQMRRQAEETADEVRYVLKSYNESSVKPWGRTLDKIAKMLGVEGWRGS